MRAMLSSILRTLGLIFRKTPQRDIQVDCSSDVDVKIESKNDTEDEREKDLITDGGRPENESYIERGKRSEHWYSRIEERVKQNSQKTRENNNLLTVVDVRTVWIARLLLTVLASVLAYVISQQLLF